jgi:hypothetical protein
MISLAAAIVAAGLAITGGIVALAAVYVFALGAHREREGQ